MARHTFDVNLPDQHNKSRNNHWGKFQDLSIDLIASTREVVITCI